ncbi:MAG: hypothetical protein C4540_07225 [Candidatus Omnitrophota bacterium]|nr:MAG: hypothetical protein C4540_07225 [Candidatus Omnitrophota bacterium]
MISRPSLRNLARAVLCSVSLLIWLIYGCTSSTKPTYFTKDIPRHIETIAENEYTLTVKAKLVGSTLWIYLPLGDIFVKTDKPERYLERFEISSNALALKAGVLKGEYMIKAVPDREKYQEYKLDKAVIDKINDVFKIFRRVLFSMERANNEVRFLCVVIADIKNGYQVTQMFYTNDIKKVSYEFISWGEFQHRSIQETIVSESIIGDKNGINVGYNDIQMKDFIVGQVLNRIKLKFGKPEVASDADVDKEVIKIIELTLKMYNFKDFTSVELYNMLTNRRIVLSPANVWAGQDE